MLTMTLSLNRSLLGYTGCQEATGECIAKVATKCVVEAQFANVWLRGQGYDGASKMAGKYTGARAIVRRLQPLALYVHCGAYCVNLITQAGYSASTDPGSLSWVHQLGVLYGQWGNFKSMFEPIATSKDTHLATLKPLCPTRWTVRNTAFRAVVGQYERVLSSLEVMAKTASKTASTASGLFEHFAKARLCWASHLPLLFLESLNA